MQIISEGYYYMDSYTGCIILIEYDGLYGFIGILKQKEIIMEKVICIDVTDDLNLAKQLYDIMINEKVFPVSFDSVIDDFIDEKLMKNYIDI